MTINQAIFIIIIVVATLGANLDEVFSVVMTL